MRNKVPRYIFFSSLQQLLFYLTVFMVSECVRYESHNFFSVIHNESDNSGNSWERDELNKWWGRGRDMPNH